MHPYTMADRIGEVPLLGRCPLRDVHIKRVSVRVLDTFPIEKLSVLDVFEL